MHEPLSSPALAAQIVARLVELELAEVLRAPCRFDPREDQGERCAQLLWDWARVLQHTTQLLEEVLRPALREPGRAHQRRITEQRGRPRGAVRWPATIRRQLTASSGALPFVYTRASRSLLAPENLLLAATLDEHGAHLSGLARLLELERGYLPAQLTLRTIDQARRSLASTPWLTRCRAHLRQHPGQLETIVAETRARTCGRPSAAPAWARRLLELRERTAAARLPAPDALADLDPSALWRQLCGLELLTQLRARAALRQRDSARSFTDARGAHFVPLATTPAWIFSQPGAALLGVLLCDQASWEEVQREAVHWAWNPPLGHRPVHEWLIIHRASDGPTDHLRPLGPLRLRYAALTSARRGLPRLQWSDPPTAGLGWT